MLAEEYLKVWNDLYIGAQTPSPGPKAFLDVYYLMNDLKETLADDRIKFYRSEWNETVVSVEELQAIVPAVCNADVTVVSNQSTNQSINQLSKHQT